jgi:hypothetical protein
MGKQLGFVLVLVAVVIGFLFWSRRAKADPRLAAAGVSPPPLLPWSVVAPGQTATTAAPSATVPLAEQKQQIQQAVAVLRSAEPPPPKREVPAVAAKPAAKKSIFGKIKGGIRKAGGAAIERGVDAGKKLTAAQIAQVQKGAQMQLSKYAGSKG